MLMYILRTKQLFAIWMMATLFSTPQFALAESNSTVAVVNGTVISKDVYDAYATLRARGGAPTGESPEQHKQVLEELVNLELVSQQAKQQGLHKDKMIAAQLKLQAQRLLSNHAISKHFEKNPIRDEDIEKAYKQQIVKGAKEYKARHILVEKEEQANALVKELDNGADFAELAKQHSTGPSGANGGELGWFSPSQMVETFAQALPTINKGEYGKEPVKTKFGWHIILIEDIRDATPPELEQVKNEIVKSLRQQSMQSYIDNLRAKAKIELSEE